MFPEVPGVLVFHHVPRYMGKLNSLMANKISIFLFPRKRLRTVRMGFREYHFKMALHLPQVPAVLAALLYPHCLSLPVYLWDQAVKNQGTVFSVI